MAQIEGTELGRCVSSSVMVLPNPSMPLLDQLARRGGDTPDAIGRQLMEEAALEGYRGGRLTHRQVGEMLGLDYWQTEDFFKERGVPLNYSAADLEDDHTTLNKIVAPL